MRFLNKNIPAIAKGPGPGPGPGPIWARAHGIIPERRGIGGGKVGMMEYTGTLGYRVWKNCVGIVI